MRSERFDSDALQLAWAPHAHWLIYQSVSEVRSSYSPTEQFYSTRLEWKPRSRDQVFWKYTLRRTLAPNGDELEHRPGVEWYRRWSSRTYTRSQVYATFVDEPLHRSFSVTPGSYLDQRFWFPWGLGNGVYRMDVSVTFSEQTRPSEERKTTFGGYSRVDWSLKRYLLMRFRLDGDYEFIHETGDSDFTWRFELRLTARF